MNKVIIIGGDGYHNSLNLARVFGINGVAPYGILVKAGNTKWSNPCSLSKYWAKVWLVDNEKEAITFCLQQFKDENEKPVIVPSSDGAELEIDDNLDLLKPYFILPSMKGCQGEISHLMNKYDQIKWAKELGLKIANAEILSLEDSLPVKTNLNFPLILKPVLSAEGKKQDIRKCDNQEELQKELDLLRFKGYNRILAQEYVNKDYEIELFGAILEKSENNPYLLSKHYREWPSVGGTVCYHEFITDITLRNQAEEILDKIKKTGYVGNIDIELFMVNGQLMLNEVNFRNSGDLYACFTNKVYYPFYSYLDMIGRNPLSYNFGYTNNSTAMDELLDTRHLIYGNLSLKEWFKDWKRCSDFSLYFKGDNKPTFARYFSVIFKIFSKAKEQKSKLAGKNKV